MCSPVRPLLSLNSIKLMDRFITIIEPRYLKYAHKLAPQQPQPEKRLELCIISGWTLVVAMFWFGWTSYPSIHWISPVLAGGLIGFSVLGMFVSLYVSLIYSGLGLMIDSITLLIRTSGPRLQH
jgi:hypothetical protein